MTKANTPRKIGAVERVCCILDIIEEEGRVGVSEMAKRLDISKGTMSTYLSTLAGEGYVVKTDGKYEFSLRYLSLGESVKHRIPVYDVIIDELNGLAEATGERCQFAMEEQGEAVVVYLTEGENAVNPSLSIGKRDYLHCIGLGKAMLAHFPRSRQERIIDTHGLPGYTDNTITDRETLFKELNRIHERGYAIDNEERVPGIRCIAVPLHRDDGEVLGAISVSGPVTRMTDSCIGDEITEQIKQVANIIEVDSLLS